MQPTTAQLNDYSKWSELINPDNYPDLETLKGKKFQCTCGNVIVLNHFRAYEHDGGIPHTNGKLYWVFHPCFNCGYDWAWHKITRRLK